MFFSSNARQVRIPFRTTSSDPSSQRERRFANDTDRGSCHASRPRGLQTDNSAAQRTVSRAAVLALAEKTYPSLFRHVARRSLAGSMTGTRPACVRHANSHPQADVRQRSPVASGYTCTCAGPSRSVCLIWQVATLEFVLDGRTATANHRHRHRHRHHHLRHPPCAAAPLPSPISTGSCRPRRSFRSPLGSRLLVRLVLDHPVDRGDVRAGRGDDDVR